MSMRIFFKKASVAICSCILGSSACSGMQLLQSVTQFGPSAFVGLPHVPNVNSVTVVGPSVFGGVVELLLCNGVTSSVVIGDKVRERAFYGYTGLSKVDLSKTNITSIDKAAFVQCTSLVEVIFPSTLTSIGKGVFAFCVSLHNISNLDLNKIDSIGEGAFRGCTSLNKDLVEKLRSKFGDNIF